MVNFYVEILGDRFSAAFAVLTAEKHIRKIRGKIRQKKFGGKNSFFAAFFALFFAFLWPPHTSSII